jgi:hypothetical protein
MLMVGAQDRQTMAANAAAQIIKRMSALPGWPSTMPKKNAFGLLMNASLAFFRQAQ